MRGIWLTDTHLDFLSDITIREFARDVQARVKEEEAAFVLITGDISSAPYLARGLRILKEQIKVPLYFIRGNHDFYHGALSDPCTIEGYLQNLSYIKLSDNTAMCGADGWYDSGYADMAASDVKLNDFRYITGLYGLTIPAAKECIKKLAQTHADKIVASVEAIVKETECKNILIAVHVPPFAESSRAPDGSPSDRHYLPFFADKAMGQAIRQIVREYKEHRFTVYCGHTHTEHYAHIADRLECYVGSAKYGDPIQSIDTIDYS